MITPNDKLQRARLEKHWSVAMASERVGVSTNTFTRWERGLQIPQMATLDLLCATFEMSAEDLGFGFVVSPSVFALSAQKQADLLLPASPEVESQEDLGSVQFVSGGERQGKANYLLTNARQFSYQRGGQVQVEGELCSRRQVIATLIGTPAAIFGARQGDNLSLLRVEEILNLCAAHIPLCWELYFEGGLVDVERVLPGYITQLLTLARHTSPYQKRAAALLSQAYQLASLLATQHQDYGVASTRAQQGLLYGELAEDPNLQVASLIRQALVCFYLKHARLRLQTYQKALHLFPQASPLLRGRVCIGLTEVCSALSQEGEAHSFLELAQEAFPTHAEDDPNYTYTHFSNAVVTLFEGMMYLNLNQPEATWRTFAHLDHTLSADLVPDRLELTVRQAAAACAMGEPDLTCHYLETAVSMAHGLGSQLRVDESYEIYERLLARWENEPAVKALEELFH
ncbi:MAG TPA: helix-turn-helix transcriptional regulator [Ktedonobacteraceae bacterium]|nr:helix-turn-helix transcriptional regulator [Ktedonobacteraceae bacterium]